MERGASKNKLFCLSFLGCVLVIYTLLGLKSRHEGNHEKMSHVAKTVQQEAEKASSPRVDIRRCDGCSKWEYPLMIQPRGGFCDNHEGDFDTIDLLIFCNSIHRHREHRQVLRNIYGPARQHMRKVKLVFLFGQDPKADSDLQEQLLVESYTHGDILQAAVNGTYNNLTIIGHNGYQWALTKCPGAKFIAKISDDNLMNIPAILDLLDQKGTTELHDVVFGFCRMRLEPFRSPGHKWHVSYEQYPLALYSPFCAGSCFIMSMATVRGVMMEAANIAFSSNGDDVNIGIIIQLTGHKVCDIPHFEADTRELVALVTGPKSNPSRIHEVCNGLSEEGPGFSAHLHGLRPQDIQLIWKHCEYFKQNLGKDLNFTCPRRKIPA